MLARFRKQASIRRRSLPDHRSASFAAMPTSTAATHLSSIVPDARREGIRRAVRSADEGHCPVEDGAEQGSGRNGEDPGPDDLAGSGPAHSAAALERADAD